MTEDNNAQEGRKYYIFVPADMSQEIELRDTTETNPYELPHEDNTYMEMVKTSYTDIYMLVDDTGLLRNLPQNHRANMFYPFGPIVGDVMIVCTETVYTDEGPDILVRDFPAATAVKMTQFMNLQKG